MTATQFTITDLTTRRIAWHRAALQLAYVCTTQAPAAAIRRFRRANQVAWGKYQAALVTVEEYRRLEGRGY